MSKIAILIGVYSYVIYFLGIFKLLYLQNVLIVSVVYFLLSLILLIKTSISLNTRLFLTDKKNILLSIFIFIQLLIYGIGVFGPEIGFDALWYHLTIPKIYIANNMIFHIPGNLFYYSVMPKLVDLLYIPALFIGNEVFTKLIHFSFGVFSVFALYKLARKFFSEKLSLLSVIILISNLVFAWEMSSSYVDLGWLFFELLSLCYFFEFNKSKNFRHLFLLAIFIGFSICVKLSAISSLVIYSILLSVTFYVQKIKFRQSLLYLLFLGLIALLIVLPYLSFSYLNTQNPFYPLFTKSIIFDHKFDFFSFIKVWSNNPDPLNPIYLIIFPILPFVYKKMNLQARLILIYCGLSLLMWYLFGQIGGSRYLLPYLGGFSILVINAYKYVEFEVIKKILIFFILMLAIFSMFYRLAASIKYMPYIFGYETKNEFLVKHLNFRFGDFYDTDYYLKNNISQNDKVLTIGFHNLYYANFNFIDYSFLKKGDRFNYIAVQNTILPKEFSSWRLIHINKQTNVKIYSNKQKVWVY